METSHRVRCPICSEPLARSGRSYLCPNRHNFDLSREGYLSLLHGRTNYRHIGDDKQMVRARVRVHRLPVFRELAEAIVGYGSPMNAGHGVLDVGCGDGFFLDQVTSAAGSTNRGVGVDISKEALATAARNYPRLFFVRSDVSQSRLPFEDASFGLVSSVFAPRPVEEIRRVLRSDGSWLVVTATPDHLGEIRAFLPLAAIGPDKMAEPTSHSFAIRRSETLNFHAQIIHEDLVAMIEMSPSIYRLKRELGPAWTERVPPELGVTFSFSVTLLGARSG